MNNIQLKIKLKTVNVRPTSNNQIIASGECQFMFYDQKKINVRQLVYQAYGQTALTLNSSGVDSIHVISGRINIFKPTEDNPNSKMLLTVENTLCLATAKSATQPAAQPQTQAQAQPAAQAQAQAQAQATQPVAQPTAKPVSQPPIAVPDRVPVAAGEFKDKDFFISKDEIPY